MNKEEALWIFGLSANYTIDELKKARNKMMKQYHPDMGGSNERAKKINAAFAFLQEELKNRPTQSHFTSRTKYKPAQSKKTKNINIKEYVMRVYEQNIYCTDKENELFKYIQNQIEGFCSIYEFLESVPTEEEIRQRILIEANSFAKDWITKRCAKKTFETLAKLKKADFDKNDNLFHPEQYLEYLNNIYEDLIRNGIIEILCKVFRVESPNATELDIMLKIVEVHKVIDKIPFDMNKNLEENITMGYDVYNTWCLREKMKFSVSYIEGEDNNHKIVECLKELKSVIFSIESKNSNDIDFVVANYLILYSNLQNRIISKLNLGPVSNSTFISLMHDINELLVEVKFYVKKNNPQYKKY